MSGTVNRRKFLKIMGWGGAGTALSGCDLPTTVTLEEGKEEVVSYLVPEEYVIPGVGVWYASSCTQCSAGCGLHGRVREGRVLKLEGSPDSKVSGGNICMMGQAAVQGHYNPDRIKTPMIRENGSLVATTWEKALNAVTSKLGSTAPGKVAWFTGTISGHQLALVQNHLDITGSGSNHFVYETIHTGVLQAVSQDMFGEATPKFRIDKAASILSFGADFLGSWNASPVHHAGQYAKFRKQQRRGLLMQIEPKMTLTGANADLWLACKPGSEGVVALGLANELINVHGKSGDGLPESVVALINKYDANTAGQQSGIAADKIKRVAKALVARSPSLVLPGASAEAQVNGYGSVAAIMLLNHLLGNVGQTIESVGAFPFPQLRARNGSTRDLYKFVEAAKGGQLDVAIFHGSNPKYAAPMGLDLAAAMNNVAMKVALSSFKDETTMAADVVLPLMSGMEDWGTHVSQNHAEQGQIGIQQPLMEKLYEDTRGFGDIALELLKSASAEQYGKFADYYAYLANAYANMPVQKEQATSAEKQWQQVLQQGFINVASAAKALPVTLPAFDDPANNVSTAKLTLVPSARLGLWDGRHANLPWLQESPDQISKMVWGSWAELHPQTAKELGIKHGDIIEVASKHGTVKVQAVLLKGMHPNAIAIPMGQGHEKGFSRYTDGLGVNPMKMLGAERDAKTGEQAMYATAVEVKSTNKNEVVVRLGGNDTQLGRKFVKTVSADQYHRTEGA